MLDVPPEVEREFTDALDAEAAEYEQEVLAALADSPDDRAVGYAADNSPPPDTRDLADHIAGLWNALDSAGLEIPQHAIERAGEELGRGEWVVFWDGDHGLWRVKHADDSDDDAPIAYAVLHAPKGGVTIHGTHYTGGQFIPGSDQAEWTDEDRAQFKQAQSAADAKLQSHGHVTAAHFKQKLAEHGSSGDLAPRHQRTARGVLDILHAQYGDKLYQRLAEDADHVDEALKLVNGDPERKRLLLGQLATLHFMAQEAHRRGIEPGGDRLAEFREPAAPESPKAAAAAPAAPTAQPPPKPATGGAEPGKHSGQIAQSASAPLPPLAGAPAQVKWAEGIRGALLERLNADPRTAGLAKTVASIHSAPWFVDHRNVPLGQLAVAAENFTGEKDAPPFNANHPLVKDFPNRVPDVPGTHALVNAGYGDPLAAKLRDLGGRWDSYQQRWKVPASRLNELRSVLEGEAGNGQVSSNGTPATQKPRENAQSAPASSPAKPEAPAPQPPQGATPGIEATPGHWAGKYKVGDKYFTSKKAAADYLSKQSEPAPPAPEAPSQREKPWHERAAESSREWDRVAKAASDDTKRKWIARIAHEHGLTPAQAEEVDQRWLDKVARGDKRPVRELEAEAAAEVKAAKPPAASPSPHADLAARVVKAHAGLHSPSFGRSILEKRLNEYERNAAASERIAAANPNAEVGMPGQPWKTHAERAAVARALADDLRQRLASMPQGAVSTTIPVGTRSPEPRKTNWTGD